MIQLYYISGHICYDCIPELIQQACSQNNVKWRDLIRDFKKIKISHNLFNMKFNDDVHILHKNMVYNNLGFVNRIKYHMKRNKKRKIFKMNELYQSKLSNIHNKKGEQHIKDVYDDCINDNDGIKGSSVGNIVNNFLKYNIKMNYNQCILICCGMIRRNITKNNRKKMKNKGNKHHVPLCFDVSLISNRYKYKFDNYGKSLFKDVMFNIMLFVAPLISCKRLKKFDKMDKCHGIKSFNFVTNIINVTISQYINFYSFDEFCIICPLLFNTMRRFEFKILAEWYGISFYEIGLYVSKGIISSFDKNFIELMCLIANYTSITFKLRNKKYVYIKRNKEYKVYNDWRKCVEDRNLKNIDEDDFWKCVQNNKTEVIIGFELLKKNKYRTRKYYIDKKIFDSRKYHIQLAKIVICKAKEKENMNNMKDIICKMLDIAVNKYTIIS